MKDISTVPQEIVHTSAHTPIWQTFIVTKKLLLQKRYLEGSEIRL